MAAQRDLEIPARSTVEFVVDVVGGPTSLTGYVGSMQIRERRTDLLPLAELLPADFTVNPTTRQVTVRIPGVSTAAYAFRRGVYDVYITGPGGDRWRLVEGRVTVSQSVTR